MRTLLCRLGCVLCLATVLTPSGLNADPLKNPKRMVDGRTVDLSPLFKWSKQHNGPRPLAAWGQVTGPVVGTNSMGWVVEGKFAGSGKEASSHRSAGPGAGRFVLRNPPLKDRAEFDRLLANYNALEAQRSELAAQESHAKSNVDDLKRARQAAGGHVPGTGRATRYAQRTDAQLKAELKALDQKLAEAQKKLAAWPNAEHYAVDGFAVDLGQTFQGLPVYDYGVPLN